MVLHVGVLATGYINGHIHIINNIFFDLAMQGFFLILSDELKMNYKVTRSLDESLLKLR